MKKLFFAIAFLTAAARLHSISGDLNEDGKLNIADQVMLNAMRPPFALTGSSDRGSPS